MSESATAPHSDAAPLANDPESVYENLHAYDFMSDPEFRLGLGSILGHPGQAASDEECKSQDVKVIAAKAFYYSKKFRLDAPIQHMRYIEWLERNHLLENQQPNGTTDEANGVPKPEGTDAVPSAPEVSTAEAAATVPAPASAAPTAMGDETPYPSSFARVVELITTGQPIPGIQQIPDTVLVGQGAPSVVPPRRKPWEKDEPVNANEKGNEAKKEHGDIQAAA